ncbi:hypothetical protein Scel_28220 [Streptomyces cellostaticus]|nr:hypothetical protein Scel_28220 [Streptomyces cellostaticus]
MTPNAASASSAPSPRSLSGRGFLGRRSGQEGRKEGTTSGKAAQKILPAYVASGVVAPDIPAKNGSAAGFTTPIAMGKPKTSVAKKLGSTSDFAHPDHDLSGYRLVVVPQLHLLTDTAIDNLLAYVQGGGTLVCGFLTGIADEDDRVRPGGMDARLRELFGIRTLHEWWPLDAGETVECDGFHGTLWSEEIEPEPGAAETVPYKGGELDGLPAVLRRGRPWYVSTLPEPEALRALLARIAAEAGVRPVLDGLPAGVETVRRGELLFLLNHEREPVTVEVPGSHHELLGAITVTGEVTLGRYGVAVLRS